MRKVDPAGLREDAHQLLLDRHPIIFLATHGQAVHKECCRLLESANYSLNSLDGQSVDAVGEIVARPGNTISAEAGIGRSTPCTCC